MWSLTQNSYRCGSITNFFILYLGHIYKNFCSRVVNTNRFQNCSTIICDLNLKLFWQVGRYLAMRLAFHFNVDGTQYKTEVNELMMNRKPLTWPAFLPQEIRILSIPFGPRVLFTKSPMAIAPMKLDIRATSAFSSSASFFKILMGFSDTWKYTTLHQNYHTCLVKWPNTGC